MVWQKENVQKIWNSKQICIFSEERVEFDFRQDEGSSVYCRWEFCVSEIPKFQSSSTKLYITLLIHLSFKNQSLPKAVSADATKGYACQAQQAIGKIIPGVSQDGAAHDPVWFLI